MRTSVRKKSAELKQISLLPWFGLIRGDIGPDV